MGEARRVRTRRSRAVHRRGARQLPDADRGCSRAAIAGPGDESRDGAVHAGAAVLGDRGAGLALQQVAGITAAAACRCRLDRTGPGLAGGGPAAAVGVAAAGRTRGGVGRRHRSVFRRPPFRTQQAGAADQPRQDLRRRHRRLHRRARLCAGGKPDPAAIGKRLRSTRRVAVRVRTDRVRHRRRPVRVVDQAPGRRQGQRSVASRPRRRARPHRQPHRGVAVRRAVLHPGGVVSVKRLAILGSTGSIGASTLAVVERHPDRFEVTALSADRQVDRLLAQCLKFRPKYAALADAAAAEQLRVEVRAAGLKCEVLAGEAALAQIAAAPEVDAVMAAIVGSPGLASTLAAARAGKQLLLANKEALVMAGALLMDAVRASGAVLLPIDSEHNAIFQALPREFDGDFGRAGVKRLWLTASGGPFLRAARAQLAQVTPEQACAHPNWVMGRKISVDSATLMNKGLEVIEASFLFRAKSAQIEVVIHPQSIVHSLVEYVDGSVLAQLGNPDMRTPIAHALAYPERIDPGVEALDLFAVASLGFERPDLDRFPSLRLAYRALQAGGSAPILLNAANEVAVASFLERRLAFDRIPELVEEVLERVAAAPVQSLEDVLAADSLARRTAMQRLETVTH